MLSTILSHLHQCGLRTGLIGLPVVVHDLKKELLLLFILCQWHIVLLHQSIGSFSRVIHYCHGWCCHPETLIGRILTPFFRVLRKEALHLLFSVQLQNVKDDSSPHCKARGKASRAEVQKDSQWVQEDSQGVSQNGWIAEGGGLSPSVISHPLQPCHQTMTGRPKFPKRNVPEMPTEGSRGTFATLKFGYFLSSSSNSIDHWEVLW